MARTEVRAVLSTVKNPRAVKPPSPAMACIKATDSDLELLSRLRCLKECLQSSYRVSINSCPISYSYFLTISLKL